jgi:DNA-directed RNA polymerase
MTDLYERELHLEENAILGGIQRYRKRLANGELADLPPGKSIYRSAIEGYSFAIEEFVVNALEGKAGRKSSAASLIASSETQPIVAAAIASRRIINAMSSGGGE